MTKAIEPTAVNNLLGGIQKIYRFDNGFGASVVQHQGSYGFDKGLWELAVLKFNDDGKRELTYDTDITDDVIGNLSDEQVSGIVSLIKNLPSGHRRSLPTADSETLVQRAIDMPSSMMKIMGMLKKDELMREISKAKGQQ